MVSFDAIKTALNGFRSWIDKRLDTLNTVKVDRSELTQSDFLQNDHTQLDYIKNKPFQDSREKTVILEEQSFILTEYNGECYWDSAALTSSLIEGNLYEVSINGFSYTTRCYRNADNANRLGILRLDCPKEIYLVSCIGQMDETATYIRILGSYNVNATISIKEVKEESYNDKYKVIRMNPDLLPISNTRELSDNCTPVLAKGGILYVDRDLPNVWPNDVGSFARVSSDGKWVAESIDLALKSDIPNNSESVLYTAQELDLDQQAQARTNIGAADLDSLIEVFEDIDELRANTGGKTVIGVIDSHYYNFRFLNEERGATMAEIREAAQSKDKDIVIRLDLDNWQGTLQYLGLVNLTDDGSTYKQALLFSTIKMNNGVINTSDNIVSGTVQLEYWYTLLDPGEDMPPVAFVNCQFAEINLAPGASHAGSFMRVNEDGLWDVEKIDVALKSDIPTDEHIKELISTPTLTDTITGQKYRLSVENGKLTMTEVTE